MDRGELWRNSSHVSGDCKAGEKATNRPSYCAFNIHSRLAKIKEIQGRFHASMPHVITTTADSFSKHCVF